MDMELSSLKKKFKDKKFAAGCSRDVIRQGAEQLGWELDDLFDKLDLGRVEKLLSLVGGEEFGQICITDCNKLRLETTLERACRDYSLFTVEGGDIIK